MRDISVEHHVAELLMRCSCVRIDLDQSWINGRYDGKVCRTSLDQVTIEQLPCGRSIDMISDDTKLSPGAEYLEENLVVVGALPPPPGFVCPHHAIVFQPASIGPDEIVDRAHVDQHDDAVGGVGCLNEFGITPHDRGDRRSANRLGFERRLT